MIGLMVIAVLGILIVILTQVYTYGLQPMVFINNVDAANANVIDFSWKVLPIAVVLSVVYSWVNTARRRMSYGYE